MTRPLPRGGTFLLAAIAGTAISNNYAIQPALTAVAADLGVPLSVIGLVPTAALAGCMTGFALLLPSPTTSLRTAWSPHTSLLLAATSPSPRPHPARSRSWPPTCSSAPPPASRPSRQHRGRAAHPGTAEPASPPWPPVCRPASC
ncbi:hypothetical protein O1M54_47700 [Streptomyces diastatochromogenes]|nr:hypothetical protein [Streptomyces diastatochromogenes]